MEPIVIIDYGAGNLRSVQKAFEHLGHQAIVSNDPRALETAPAVVFPGQGASEPAMAALTSSGMADAIRQAIARAVPFFGVCLGLQLLMEWSEESDTTCLGVLPGTVRKLVPSALKVPHMGWNNVALLTDHPVFDEVPDQSHFYFVHSYYAVPQDDAHVLATTEYGIPFCSVAAKGNLIATQFHPEKSGPLGLRLYDNFVRRLVDREAAPAR